MKKIFSFFFFLVSLNVWSQGNLGSTIQTPVSKYSATKPDMLEVGLSTGVFGSFGDIDYRPSWMVELHARKAIDYLFSFRASIKTGILKAADDTNGEIRTNYLSTSAQLLLTLNNIRWNAAGTRKYNPYLLIGGGLHRFSLEIIEQRNLPIEAVDQKIQTQMEVGGGIAFRVNEKINIGFESLLFLPFGSGSDLLDGVKRQTKDLLNFTSVRVNYNIGNSKNKTEPLYWVNPMETMMEDISELKRNQGYELKDTDKDGVIDAFDLEKNTPKDALVDTRGRTLDSDRDSYPDHLDIEPYSPVGAKVDKNGKQIEAQQDYVTEGEVQNMINAALKSQTENQGKEFDKEKALINWLLPMIHFDIDSKDIRYTDYGSMANIAKIIRANPKLKFIVRGFADATASTNYNLQLSYDRAAAVISFLMEMYQIPRQQLILQYSGEEAALVPNVTGSVMNRRVEISVANAEDKEMDKP